MPLLLTLYKLVGPVGAAALAACVWLWFANAGLRGDLAAEVKAFADYKLVQVGTLNTAVMVALEAEREATAIAHQAELEAVAADREIEIVTETIIREVEVFVTEEVDTNFPIPNAWVYLHDAGASGTAVAQLASGSANSDAASDAFTMSDTSELLAKNYGACRIDAEHLEGLQEYSNDIQTWWAGVEAAWPSAGGEGVPVD